MTSTFAHLGGPPIFVYLMTTNLKPRQFIATGAFLFASTNLLKVPAYFYADLFDADLITSALWPWLLIPVGVLVGRALVSRINQVWFERISVSFLALGALVLLLV